MLLGERRFIQHDRELVLRRIPAARDLARSQGIVEKKSTMPVPEKGASGRRHADTDRGGNASATAESDHSPNRTQGKRNGGQYDWAPFGHNLRNLNR